MVLHMTMDTIPENKSRSNVDIVYPGVSYYQGIFDNMPLLNASTVPGGEPSVHGSQCNELLQLLKQVNNSYENFVSNTNHMIGNLKAEIDELRQKSEANTIVSQQLMALFNHQLNRIDDIQTPASVEKNAEPTTNSSYLCSAVVPDVTLSSSPPVDTMSSVSFLYKSPVLTSMWNQLSLHSGVEARWYLQKYQFTHTEKNDKLYNLLTDALKRDILRCPELTLSEFLVNNMSQIKTWTEQHYSYLSEPVEPVVKLDNFDISNGYKLKNGHESIATVWEEFYHGLDGQPAIYELEKKYGTKWRGGSHSLISKSLTRRKCVYKFIVYGIKRHNMRPSEIIAWLDKLASRGRKRSKKANITWFSRNYANAVRELYGVDSLGSVNLKDDY